jgi:hypothetical protein
MASNLSITVGTTISFADHGADFSPSPNAVIEVGTPIDGQLSLASLAAAAARQSAKIDAGANRGPSYTVISCIEVASGAAVSGELVSLYWAPSGSAIAAVGNPGGVSGVDSAYTGTAQDSLTDSLKQLVPIGSHIATIDDTLDAVPFQIAVVNSHFWLPLRYGSLIVVNNLTGSLHTDDIEMNIVFISNTPQGS